MRIVVASGKGGTGKTTIAVNLLLTLAELEAPARPRELTFLDCDVEEPNAHLFLNPTIERQEDVGILLPQVDFDACTYCGTCADVCVFHALAVVGKRVMVFPQLCHGCGSCTYNCPESAIQEVLNPTGKLERGTVQVNDVQVQFAQGIMNVGEAMATPIIRQLKQRYLPQTRDALAILDAPPGNACPVVETMHAMDFVLLVTEPTPFGLHDLKVATQVARDELKVPAGVVLNRVGVGDKGVEAFCEEVDLPILMRIPLDRRIAEAYAEGIPMVEAFPRYKPLFVDLYQQIRSHLNVSQEVPDA
jgi:MinD superfamily P-loop ATPase